jgi:hypothetical protein
MHDRRGRDGQWHGEEQREHRREHRAEAESGKQRQRRGQAGGQADDDEVHGASILSGRYLAVSFELARSNAPDRESGTGAKPNLQGCSRMRVIEEMRRYGRPSTVRSLKR